MTSKLKLVNEEWWECNINVLRCCKVNVKKCKSWQITALVSMESALHMFRDFSRAQAVWNGLKVPSLTSSFHLPLWYWLKLNLTS